MARRRRLPERRTEEIPLGRKGAEPDAPAHHRPDRRPHQVLAAISHDLRTPITRMRLPLRIHRGRKPIAAACFAISTICRSMLESVLSFLRNDASWNR